LWLVEGAFGARGVIAMQTQDLLKFLEETKERLTPAKAQELAKQIASGEGREQVSRLAKDMLDWSQRNRERVTELVRREVASQLKGMGLASHSEMEALRKRVRELERAAGISTKRSPAKKSTAKRTPAKRSSAKRTTKTRSSSSSSES
jgi:polyhydroxyalkanoate synthesis regulator phasin